MKHEVGRRSIKRMRIKIADAPGALGAFTTRLGEFNVRFGEITTASVGRSSRVRDVDVIAPDEATFDRVCDEVRAMDGVDLLGVTDVVRERHRGGKIATKAQVAVRSLDDLGIVYTPGVASMCLQIAAEPELARRYTAISNTVAIVTNGTAILGLGDIGAVAGMPVTPWRRDAVDFRRPG